MKPIPWSLIAALNFIVSIGNVTVGNDWYWWVIPGVSGVLCTACAIQEEWK